MINQWSENDQEHFKRVFPLLRNDEGYVVELNHGRPKLGGGGQYSEVIISFLVD